jgi:conjugal transfer pilus assembly protein TraD
MSVFDRSYEMPWRPAYEGFAAAAWITAFFYFLYQAVFNGTAVVVTFALALTSLFIGFYRVNQAVRILALRASLNGRAIETITPAQLRDLSGDAAQVWMGFGFEWLPVHAQRLYELSKLDVKKFVVGTFVLRLLGYRTNPQPDSEIGVAFIHGVEPREYAIYRPLQNFEGGTCIAGTTQSGKGVLLTHLVSQAIYRGDIIVVIDPKNSKRLKNAVLRACKDSGRAPPLEFHPAFPDRGIRLDPMYSWQKPTELASRIESVMAPDTSGAFKAFGWSAVNVVVQACVANEDRPNLLKLTQYIEGGIEPILQATLERHFIEHAPSNWRDAVQPYLRLAREMKKRPSEDATDQLIAYVLYYKRDVSHNVRDKSIDSQIKVFEHNREHYAKITANLLPILSQLTSGSLGKSLSPDPFDTADERPVMNLQKVCDGGHVLYIALDSLPDPVTASAIGAITLADLAALAGMRYNSGQYGKRITVIVDEVSNVINRPLIEILNKGAESGINCICAMQTMSDLADRLGSPDAARMALGNLNNLVALRSKDRFTQDFIVETFGKTYIKNVDLAFSTRQDKALHDFGGVYSKSLTSSREEIVPVDILGKLPNCQFFASLSGRLYKGRVPILLTDK